MRNIVVIIPVSSFITSKTRLSPFLSVDERSNLLRCMLKDIIETLKSEDISDIVITSKDDDALSYAKSLNLDVFKESEHECDFLNLALLETIEYIKQTKTDSQILILPADIPLISTENIQYIKSHFKDFIIAPSRGGGTNLLYISDHEFIPEFGEFSFFKHQIQAKKREIPLNIYDSFFLSLDINTPEDLGELMLHGKMTQTYNYLDKINIKVKNNHGKERLNVYRK